MENEGNNTAALEAEYIDYLMKTPYEALTKRERSLQVKLKAAEMLKRMGFANNQHLPRINVSRGAKKHAKTMSKVRASLGRIRRIEQMSNEARRRAMIRYKKWLAEQKVARGPPRAKDTRRNSRSRSALLSATRRASRQRILTQRRKIKSEPMPAIPEENEDNTIAELGSRIAKTTLNNNA